MRQAHTARSARDERDQRGTSETSGAGHRTSDISAGRARPARKQDQRGTSEISAERDQWRRPPDEQHQRGTSEASAEARPARNERRPAGGVRPAARKLPDEPGASGSARRVRAEANQSSGEAPEGRARAERAKTSGDARYERREGVRGRPKAAGRLAQKLPSPALKEAERSGSYNPGDLNTLTGGTVRSGTVQGQQREEQRTPCPVNLRGPERTRSGEARRVRDTDQGQESVLRRD